MSVDIRDVVEIGGEEEVRGGGGALLFFIGLEIGHGGNLLLSFVRSSNGLRCFRFIFLLSLLLFKSARCVWVHWVTVHFAAHPV